ncbi:MAG: peptide ABC transporter substrate-binding protein [Ruminococcus sp.]|nr:peptide ABC transporter substrate-binding protein [Ruminococcus sp.]
MRSQKLTALLLCTSLSAFALGSCGNTDRGDGSGHMYSLTLLENPETLDPQYADDPSSNTIIKNMFSGLFDVDKNGNIVCCNAESYDVSDDGLVYTFHLRSDNYWFYDKNKDDIIQEDEYFPVVADDYVFALKRLLDPSMHSPYATDFTCIQHGELINRGELSLELAGVSAISDTTLQIKLDYPSAEFLKLLSTPAAYPCNEKFFYSTKGRYGLDDESVMSNGAFYVRRWFYDPYGSNNILYMRANNVNEREGYDISPSYLSFEIRDTDAEVRQDFKDEFTECITSMSSSGYNSGKYIVESERSVTLGLIFNTEDKTFSDLNLRKALSLSIDRNALKSQISDDVKVAYGIFPPAVKLLGRSYRELSSDSQFDVYNLKSAKSYLEKAKIELGTRSIDSTKILVNSSAVNSAPLHSISQAWQDSLGIYAGIEDVTDDEFYSRIRNGEFTIALYPLKSNSSSGLSVVRKFENTRCLSYALGEDNTLAENIMKCPSASSLVDVYSDTERAILSEFGFIPLLYKNCYLIANSDNEEIYYDSFSGAVDYRNAKNYR